MLRRHHQVPSPKVLYNNINIITFSSSSFLLPHLHSSTQSASFYSPRTKMPKQFYSKRPVKTRFGEMNLAEFSSRAESRFGDIFHHMIKREERARYSWLFAKRVARKGRKTRTRSDPVYILRAMAAYAELPYTPRLKAQDFSLIRILFPEDFVRLSPRHFLALTASLEKDELAAAPFKQKADPVSLTQVQKLINRHNTNEPVEKTFEKTIFQCWVCGCRIADLHRQQRVFLPQENMVVVRQIRAGRGRSFVRYIPSTREQFERVWRVRPIAQGTTRHALRSAINQRLRTIHQQQLRSFAFTPRNKVSTETNNDDVFREDEMKEQKKRLLRKEARFTSSSIAAGAEEYLAGVLGVSDAEVVNVTGHGSISRELYASSQRSTRRTPARQQIKNITSLITAIFPDGKY